MMPIISSGSGGYPLKLLNSCNFNYIIFYYSNSFSFYNKSYLYFDIASDYPNFEFELYWLD